MCHIYLHISIVAGKLSENLRRSVCKEKTLYKVKTLDQWRYESFGEKLKAKRLVWEMVIPVEGATKPARYKRDRLEKY